MRRSFWPSHPLIPILHVLQWQVHTGCVLADISGYDTRSRKELTVAAIRSIGAVILPPSGTRSPYASAFRYYISSTQFWYCIWSTPLCRLPTISILWNLIKFEIPACAGTLWSCTSSIWNLFAVSLPPHGLTWWMLNHSQTILYSPFLLTTI